METDCTRNRNLYGLTGDCWRPFFFLIFYDNALDLLTHTKHVNRRCSSEEEGNCQSDPHRSKATKLLNETTRADCCWAPWAQARPGVNECWVETWLQWYRDCIETREMVVRWVVHWLRKFIYNTGWLDILSGLNQRLYIYIDHYVGADRR